MACGVASPPSTHSAHTSLTSVYFSAFSKCAEIVEDGRRLENLSWRIWNRETLCCESQPRLSTTPAIDIAKPRPGRKDVPELSTSIDSEISDLSDVCEDSQEVPIITAPRDIKPSQPPSRNITIAASRGKEKHITSLGLEKMVTSIQEKQEIEPLSPTINHAMPTILQSTDITPRPTSPTVNAPFRSSGSSSSTAPLSSPGSDCSARQTVGSDTSAELLTSHSVVRGFSPNRVSSSYRSHTHLAPAPVPANLALHNKSERSKKSTGFMLGGSSGEDDSSFEDQMLSSQKQSSLTAGLKQPLVSKKQLSFRDEVESRTLNNKSHEDEEVFESESEDEMPDSAIEDDSEEDDEDEDEDWEDDVSESGENTVTDKPLFQRVDSKPKLVSRRSLLTSLMSEGDRQAAFADMASRSTPALKRSRTSTTNGFSNMTSPKQDASLHIRGGLMTPSKPIPRTKSSIYQFSLSPKTTRRNMLANEMTESLRKDVLWERAQKKSTANAVLKRRHTAHNVTDLKHYPGEDGHTSTEESRNNSWNYYYSHGLGEYHVAGW